MQLIKAEKKKSLWNSSFIRVLIYAVLCTFTMSVSNTVLPLYVINQLGHSNTESGLLGTLFTVGSVLCRFFTGWLSDKFGRRIMLIIGAVMVGTALIFMGFTTSFILILIIKTYQGIGNSFNTTASNAAASDVLPKERLGDGIGYFGLNTSVINAVGPTVALALMGVMATAGGPNYSLPLFIAGASGIAAAVIGASLNYEKKMTRIPGVKAAGEKTRFNISDYIEKRALMPALLQFFQAFAMGAGVFMIIFANSMSFVSISYYFIISAAVSVATRLIVGSRMDKMKPVSAVMIPLAMMIASYVYLGATLSEMAFLVNSVVSGIYGAMLMPTFNSLALRLCPDKRKGAASATYWLGFDGGMAFGMIVFGLVIDAGGFAAAFNSAGVYMVIFGIVAFLVLRKVKPIREIDSPSD